MATSPPSVEERLAVFEKQTTTIQNSLNDLTVLIRSLLPPVPPGNDDNILQMADAPTYVTIAAVESKITLDRAKLHALTRNPSSSTNPCSSPPSTSLGLTVLPNRTYDPTPPPLTVVADANVTRRNSSGRPARCPNIPNRSRAEPTAPYASILADPDGSSAISQGSHHGDLDILRDSTTSLSARNQKDALDNALDNAKIRPLMMN